MAHKLAFMTIGFLHEPIGSSRVQGFVDRVPGVFDAAESSHGFQVRSVRNLETRQHSWGEVVLPSCYPKLDDEMRAAATLSVWDDLESVSAFAYNGAHGEALTNRKDWFQPLGLPGYVAWWVPDGHQVDWKEGAERLDHLHAHGPSAFAFNFAKPFDADGKPCRLDRQAIQAKTQNNSSGAS